MKFFHLSDLHIGLKLQNRDLKEDQELILNEIVNDAAEEQPDAVLIAGDVYDKAVPSAESVEMFDSFLERLTKAVPEAEILIISGNHDSAPRINCYRGLLTSHRVHMIGQPPLNPEEYIEKVTLTDAYGPVNFYLLPFVKPSMVRQVVGEESDEASLSYDETVRRLLAREQIRETERNVLVSHQFYLPVGKTAEEVERMDSEIRTVGNIDQVSAAYLTPFDYAALGHIHKPMTVGENRFRYCGTPLACSVSEAGQKKGILEVTLLAPGTPADIRVLPLAPRKEVRVIKGTFADVLAQGCEDYVTVVLTDTKDLDVVDMQDRLRAAFPFLLEIRRETVRGADYTTGGGQVREMDPFELCCSFVPELEEEEKDLLADVIRSVQEQEENR